MGYGDFCLLVAIRDGSKSGELDVSDLLAEFPNEMLVVAVRQKTVAVRENGTATLTEHGRAAINQFSVDKA